MKNTIILKLAVVVLCFLGLSCSSNDNGIQTLELKTDKAEILGDGTEKVTFTVLADGQNVTDKARINNITGSTVVQGASFSSTRPGKYSFSATYEGVTSNTEEVTVKSNDASGGSFYRGVLAIRFTGTWCQYCYGVDMIMKSLEENELKGRLVHVAMHAGDDMSPTNEETWISYFNPDGYPWIFFDMRMSIGPMTIKDLYLETMEEIIELCPPTTGFKVESTVENGTATVNVTVKASEADNYKLNVLVLESGIIADQASETIIVKDHEHKHVLRDSVNSSVEGEDLGNMNADQEVTKSYTFDISKFKAENCELAVYTMNKDGNKWVINNVGYAAINGSTPYRYEN